MLDRANRLSSSPDPFSEEFQDLKTMFLKLKFPEKLIDSTFKRFHASQDQNQNRIEPVQSPVLIMLPFKDPEIRRLRTPTTKRPSIVYYNQFSQVGKSRKM